MFGLFLVSALTLGAVGTAGNHCIQNSLTAKECVQYVKGTAVHDYSTLNK